VHERVDLADVHADENAASRVLAARPLGNE
jgi:hypothetical protein